MNEKIEKRVNLLTNIIFFVVVVLFALLRVCSHYGLFSFLGEYGSYFMSLFVQVGIIFALPTILMKILSKSKYKEVVSFCCYKKATTKVVLLSFVLGVIVFFLNVYASNFFNNIIERFGYKHTSHTSSIDSTWWGLILNLLCTAVLPAVCEETLCRGLLLNGHSMVGLRKSILISGVLFGLLHMNIEQFFYATLIGLFLAYLCWGCGSIWPCIIVHFMNNALSVVLNFANAQGWAAGSIFEWISNIVSANGFIGFLLFFFFLCLLFYLLGYFSKVMFVSSFKSSFVDKEREFASFAVRESFFKYVDELKNANSVPDLKDEIEVLENNTIEKFADTNFEKILKHAVLSESKQKTVTMNAASKVFLIGSIVLSAAITILTFVWGIL